MAFATKQVFDQVLPINAGGHYRFWARGPGVIAGVIQMDGVPFAGRAFLHAADGTLLGYRRTGADGLYEFVGLPGGEYRLILEDDREGVRRSKVEHVIVPGLPAPTTRVAWRVYITANEGGSYKGLTELEFLGAGDVQLTSSAAALAKAFASSFVNGDNSPYRAFDGNTTGSGWLSINNLSDEYIGWQFSEPYGPDVDVLKVAIRGSWNEALGSPVDFLIQSSVDDANWVTEMTVTGQTGWTGASDRRVFTLP